MGTNHRVPGRQEKRWPAFVPLVVESELSPTDAARVPLFRGPARNCQMGPPYSTTPALLWRITTTTICRLRREAA